jgi:hypothetical protein
MKVTDYYEQASYLLTYSSRPYYTPQTTNQKTELFIATAAPQISRIHCVNGVVAFIQLKY